MDSLTKILVTTRLEEKAPIEGYISLAVTMLIGALIIIALIRSIPSFRERSTTFKFVVYVLAAICVPIAIFIVPIVKIISVAKRKKTNKKNPYISQNAVQKPKHTPSDIIYCSECGASYIKGEEPDVCEDCGCVIHEQ